MHVWCEHVWQISSQSAYPEISLLRKILPVLGRGEAPLRNTHLINIIIHWESNSTQCGNRNFWRHLGARRTFHTGGCFLILIVLDLSIACVLLGNAITPFLEPSHLVSVITPYFGSSVSPTSVLKEKVSSFSDPSYFFFF